MNQLIIRALVRRRDASLVRKRKGNVAYALEPCGRLGNNIQQLLVGLIHCKTLGGSIIVSPRLKEVCAMAGLDIAKSRYYSEEHLLDVDCHVIKFMNFLHLTDYALFSGRYHERYAHGRHPRRSSFIGSPVINAQMQAAAQELRNCLADESRLNLGRDIFEKIKDADTIVIQLRSGDVSGLGHDMYLTNPLSYYLWLRRSYSKSVIVTELNPPHALLQDIRELFPECLLVSQSADKDFSVLRHCRNLATSGVGTFPIAAALLNDSLQHLYYSDLYLREHLNPEHLTGGNLFKHCFATQGYFAKWMTSSIDERRRLVKSFEPRPQSFSREYE